MSDARAGGVRIEAGTDTVQAFLGRVRLEAAHTRPRCRGKSKGALVGGGRTVGALMPRSMLTVLVPPVLSMTFIVSLFV